MPKIYLMGQIFLVDISASSDFNEQRRKFGVWPFLGPITLKFKDGFFSRHNQLKLLSVQHYQTHYQKINGIPPDAI